MLDDGTDEPRELRDVIFNLGDHTTHKDRPFTGQPHTDQGLRGKQEVSGIRFRDVADCIVRAMIYGNKDATDEMRRRADDGTLNYNDVYDLDFSGIDPIAIVQNAMCEIEKMMGIYPNIPEPKEGDEK